MYLIVILVALGLLQVWGANNPLHRDRMVDRWFTWLRQWSWSSRQPWLELLAAVVVPAVLLYLVTFYSPAWLVLILSLVVLLYSLGRGEFGMEVAEYRRACSANDWAQALLLARAQGADCDDIAATNWPDLHRAVLKAVAYQGFERLFAVLFWFLMFGPAGALLYRLSWMYRSHRAAAVPNRWLWALEWPAVRVLAASFAVTGNFVGCINRWKIHALSLTSRTGDVLIDTVSGALSVDDDSVQSCDVTQREVAAVRRLYTRTLWFWVAAIALWTLLY